MERPHISMTELIQAATTDSRATLAASWIHRTKQSVLGGGDYPSRAEMSVFGLTEANFLVLAGFINTVPGGVASPLTEYFLSEPVEEAVKRGEKRPMTAVAMTHGSLIPRGTDAFKFVSEDNYQKADGSMKIPSGFELNLSHLHAETSCGPSLGDSLNTRRGYVSNLLSYQESLREIARQSCSGFIKRPLHVEIHGIEAYVGSQVGPMPGNNTFDIHNASSIYFLPSSTEQLSELAESSLTLPQYDSNEFYGIEGLNDAFRECMDDGRLIFGQACLDRRQGLTAIHPSRGNINLEILKEELKSERKLLRRSFFGVDWPSTGWQLEGHTEAPLVILNIGDDEKMTSLAYWLMTQPGAISRDGMRYLAPTAPAIVNIPESMFDGNHNSEAQIFSTQITQLIANLDRATYGRTLMGHNRSNFYASINGQINQVDMPAGMQVAHSTKAEGYVGGLRIPSLFLSDPTARPLDLNPRIWTTITDRPLGPVVE